MTPAMQVRLLRVLQERIFEPLGGIESVSVDIRVVVATNKNLPDLIKNGLFREDLYYRIKVLKINLPPLRERKCDIPLLCDYFISLYNARFKKNIREVSGKALDTLLSHEYPGNIRELENILEHAFIFCKGSVIEPGHLPSEIVCGKIGAGKSENIFDTVQTFEELEKLFLTHIINQVGGSKIKAAEKLGMHKATLFRKIKNLGIEGE
jgi:transcriptional regulator with PAS, ATPase and Fis domain